VRRRDGDVLDLQMFQTAGGGQGQCFQKAGLVIRSPGRSRTLVSAPLVSERH
jgi:hypothetical protein